MMKSPAMGVRRTRVAKLTTPTLSDFLCPLTLDQNPSPPPPMLNAKKLKMLTAAVDFKNPPKVKKMFNGIKNKADLFCDYIKSSRLEWLQHRVNYNQVLTVLHDWFRSLVIAMNSNMKRLQAQLQNTQMALMMTKSWNVANKAEVVGYTKNTRENSKK
mmetsp:Transcript_26115/g.60038  ORF Transcript_26115/g.60038 Transcript_26115/m.60038 type:complete len:158 (-) Transcript_26115:891-1364(-)